MHRGMADSTAKEDACTKRLFAGELENLPTPDSNVVRIFLSSTFTDFEHERNLLMTTVTPWLQKFCWERGLEFQLVDMRWGVTDDVSESQGTSDIVLKEVDKARALSQGPYFVAFLGDKYGSRFFPRVIEASEFEVLLRAARTACRETTLLERWYVKDRNAIPAVYSLQPIHKYFPHYNDETAPNEKKRNKDRADWSAVNILLSTLLKMAARVAVNTGHMTKQASMKYFVAVTESEVTRGIFESKNADKRTLCFMRSFANPGIDIRHTKAGRFTDLDSKRLDQEAAELRELLKQTSVPQRLGSDNIQCFTVPWTEKGIDPELPQHALYLHQLETAFLLQIERLIEVNHKESKVHSSIKQIYDEVLHHSIYCKQQNTVFCGREDLLSHIGDTAKELHNIEQETVKDVGAYIQQVLIKRDSVGGDEMDVVDPKRHLLRALRHNKKLPLQKYHKPVVLCGISGTGKTAIMAQLHQRSVSWFRPRKPTRIVRFVGISRGSSSLHHLIISTCQQIWENYKGVNRLRVSDLERDPSFLFIYFQNLLLQVDTTKQPLIILWDGMEKLPMNDELNELRWLPLSLPEGVLFIMAMTADCSLVDSFHQVLPDRNVMATPPLPIDQAKQMLEKLMRRVHRQITPQQRDSVMGAYKLCAQPLFMKLAFEAAKFWASYHSVDQCSLGLSVKSAIDQMLQRLERIHGTVLVSRSLGLMTVSREGLSDSEMEDILSLDDEVLQNVYLYHLPPNPLYIRLPQILWQRVLYDLSSYITQRRVHNAIVSTWQHKQFNDAATKRYVNPVKVDLHKSLAQYFTGEWSEKVKPLKLYKRKRGEYPKCLRGAARQPIYVSECKVNARKIVELPYHLVNAQMPYSLVHIVCSCVVWLNAAIEVHSPGGCLREFHQLLDLMKENMISTEEQLEELNSEKNRLMLQADTEDSSAQQQHLQNAVEAVEAELKMKQQCCKDVASVIDIIIMAQDAISRQPQGLAPVILGQFENEELESSCLSELRQSCIQFVQSTKLPLYVPLTKCFPRPGGFLKAQVDFVLGFNQNDVWEESRLHISHDGNILYTVERQSEGGDLLKQLDLTKNASVKTSLMLPGLRVRTLKLLSNDRYLSLEVYCPEKKTRTMIVDLQHKQELAVPDNCQLLAFSQTGIFCLILQDPEELRVQEEEERANRRGGRDEGLVIATVYEVSTGEITKLRVITPAPIHVHSAIFSANDSTVVLNASDGHQYAYAVEAARLKSSFGPSRPGSLLLTAPINRLMQFLPRNRFLSSGVSTANASNLYVHNFSAVDTLAEFKGHEQPIKFVVANIEQTIAASSDGLQVIVWDLEKSRIMSVCPDSKFCEFITFCGDCDDLIMGGHLKEAAPLSVWYTGPKQKPLSQAVMVHAVAAQRGIVFLESIPEKNLLVSATIDNTIRIWDLKELTNFCHKRIEGCGDQLDVVMSKMMKERCMRPKRFGEGLVETTCTALSKCGKVACAGTQDGWVLFFDLLTMQPIHHQNVEKRVTHVVSCDDGQHFVSCSLIIAVWDLDGNKVRVLAELNEECVSAVQKSNVFAVGFCNSAQVWNVNSGEQIASIADNLCFSFIDLTEDASKLLCTLADAPVIINLKDQKPVNIITPSSPVCPALCASFSPGDKMAGCGVTDGGIRVVLVDGGNTILRLKQESPVKCLTFMHSRPWLLTGAGNQVLIWSLHTGALLHTLIRHTDTVTRIFISSGENHFVSVGQDKQLIAWDAKECCSLSALHACTKLERTLSFHNDLSLAVYGPIDVSHLAVLRSNPSLSNALQGHLNEKVPGLVQYAQAYALTFSSQKITAKTSVACTIL